MSAFKTKTGRNLKLEIEPGTFLVANSAVLLAEVMDVVTTKTIDGLQGYDFIKVDCGLNDIIRPALYGAQHEIEIVKKS